MTDPARAALEDATYLADAALHLTQHLAQEHPDFRCEDLGNVKHFAAKVRARAADTARPGKHEAWCARDHFAADPCEEGDTARPGLDVEALTDLLMDLRMDGPAEEGWTYQQTMRHYAARIIVARAARLTEDRP